MKGFTYFPLNTCIGIYELFLFLDRGSSAKVHSVPTEASHGHIAIGRLV